MVLLAAPGSASAEPSVPKADTPCSAQYADTMTWPPEVKMPLVCADQPAGFKWKSFTDPYPVSDRWLSYGPPMKLHGQGLRNASIKSGDWIAAPQDPDSSCRAEQLAVVSAGEVGPPIVTEGEKGKPLSLQLVPNLFSITMSGYCLWTKVSS
jgi:hypothetical protein